MKLLGHPESAGRRAVVIGLDGTPFSFLKNEIEAGNLPNLAALASKGNLVPMNTEIPTISSVAWASFMTGRNPGDHGIFGFTDRKPGTYDLYFPNYSNLKEEPFWELLGRQGKRCCVLNVPSTYPARPVNGILVSGFVAPNLERATYPRETFEFLQQIGYRIDVDSSRARESLDHLIEDLHVTTEKRREAMQRLWAQEDWDLFICVFTETDRLHHFMWKHYEQNDPVYRPEFLRYYQRIDEIIGEFVEGLPGDVALYLLSDHGFCSIEHEVYLNAILAEGGYLAFNSSEPKMLNDIDPAGTRAYCMDPGRIYINLKGREPGGIVEPGDEYENLMAELALLAGDLTSPATGEKMVADVKYGRDLYDGPCSAVGPDLVVVPGEATTSRGQWHGKRQQAHQLCRECILKMTPWPGMRMMKHQKNCTSAILPG